MADGVTADKAAKETDRTQAKGRESLDDLKQRLGFSPDGLSVDEVSRRLRQYGYNELPEKRTNPFFKFLSYLWGPIPWMIEIAALLSAVVRHWPDLGIIVLLLMGNAVVGFWEEYQADTTIAALKSKLAMQARAKRGGKWSLIPGRELVPGDLIQLRAGDIVPADAALLDGDPVEVDQSALTGESMPVEKSTGDTVYSGSVLRRGEIGAFVFATGTGTYFGKTAQLVESAQSTSHFQQAILKIGNYLIVLALVLVMFILGVALFRGDPMMTTVQFALVLTVAAIPVAMPTVLSVTMAVGARLLAAKQAIVTRLSSIEEMAGIDILCSDKTGTLTQNRLTLGDPYTVKDVAAQDVIVTAALASREENQDPIDLAILDGVEDRAGLAHYTVTHFDPFDAVKKRTESRLDGPDKHSFRASKGAPQVILDLCEESDDVKNAARAAIDEFARRGYRSLGVARTDKKDRWRLLGVIPLFDPPREDSKEVIEAARGMGVSVKMVTGDQAAIAGEIAGQLDIGRDILDATILGDVRHHESGQVADRIEQADGFAQVFPEHKYHIVDVLQQRGHIVGMTGDGVNDAPALKKADVGIAVSGATDAARSAAAIVLLSKGLSVIVDAVRESRRIFQRMNSYALYRITETIRVLLLMTLSILAFNFYPVTTIMIVLLALLNDGAILSIAYDRAKSGDSPESWHMHEVLGVSTMLGVFGVIASFGIFYLGEQVFHQSREFIQTMIYLKLSVSGHMTVFVTRTRGRFWSYRPSWILLGAVIGTQIIATIMSSVGILMHPIGFNWAAFVWAYAFVWFVAEDQVKLLAFKIFSPGKGDALNFMRRMSSSR